MFERYTEKARRVIFFARYEAAQYGSPYIETEHLLFGLVRETSYLITDLIPSVDPSYAERWRKRVEPQRRHNVSTSVDLPLSNESKRVVAFAAEEAERLRNSHIGTEHLLMAMLRERHAAYSMLAEIGITLEGARHHFSTHDYSQAQAAEGGMGAGSGSVRLMRHAPSISFVESSSAKEVATVHGTFTTHLPRDGEIVQFEEEGKRRRRYKVVEVAYVFESVRGQAQSREQKLANIVVSVEEQS